MPRVVKLGIPNLAIPRRHGQEAKSQCKLATPYLTIYLGLFTAFSVPHHIKPWGREPKMKRSDARERIKKLAD
jgi:hypothetical protein